MKKYMTYKEMCDLFIKNNDNGNPPITGYIVFASESFNKPYDEKSRTYRLSSDNKAFQTDKGGYSIFASCLDGTDQCLRLDGYICGENTWKIEKCYLEVCAICSVTNNIGISVYSIYHPDEKVLAGVNDETPKWCDIVEGENPDGETELGFNMGEVFIPFSQCFKI